MVLVQLNQHLDHIRGRSSELMREYLYDEYFGEQAAQVLAAQWITAN